MRVNSSKNPCITMISNQNFFINFSLITTEKKLKIYKILCKKKEQKEQKQTNKKTKAYWYSSDNILDWTQSIVHF